MATNIKGLEPAQQALKLSSERRPTKNNPLIQPIENSRWVSLDICQFNESDLAPRFALVALMPHFATPDLSSALFDTWLHNQINKQFLTTIGEHLGVEKPSERHFIISKVPILRKGCPIPAPRVGDILQNELPEFHRVKFKNMLSKSANNEQLIRQKMNLPCFLANDFLHSLDKLRKILASHDSQDITLTPRTEKIFKWFIQVHEALAPIEEDRRFVIFSSRDFTHNASWTFLKENRKSNRNSIPTRGWDSFVKNWIVHHNQVCEDVKSSAPLFLGVPAFKELHQQSMDSKWEVLPDLDSVEIAKLYRSYSALRWPNSKNQSDYFDDGDYSTGDYYRNILIDESKVHFRSFFNMVLIIARQRAQSKQYFDLDPTEKVEAVIARNRKNGFFAIYRTTQPAEQIQTQTQLLVTHSRGEVIISPAWRRIGAPTGKKALNTPDQFETLDSFKANDNCGLTDLRIGRSHGVVASGGVSHAIALTLSIVDRDPKTFARTSLFREGNWRLSESDFLDLNKSALLGVNSPVTHELHHYLKWLEGADVCEHDPMIKHFKGAKLLSGDIQMFDFGECNLTAKVGVRFELASESDAVAQTQNFIAALNNSGTHNFGQIKSLIEPLKDQLSFKAVPFFEIDGQEVVESDWMNAVKQKNGYFKIKKGALIPEAQYKVLLDQYLLRKRVLEKYKNLRLTDMWHLHSLVSDQSLEGAFSPEEYLKHLNLNITTLWSKIDQDLREALRHHLADEKFGNLGQTLRPYQKDGVIWLLLRALLGYGACLADEMGLGKTLQAITLIKLMKSEGFKALIVMPKTLVHNWRAELAKFAPELSVGYFPDDKIDADTTVTLTTYSRLRINAEELAKTSWNLVVLDEAHAIKNRDSVTAEAANQLKAEAKMALTGTPIENNATELWSLMDWLNSDFLGTHASFTKYVRYARFGENKNQLLKPLRAALEPVLLRRLKNDPVVGLDLPPKIFQDLRIELSHTQYILYETVVQTTLIATADQALPPFVRSALYLKAINHIKQILCHPEVFFGNQDDTVVLDADGENYKKSLINRCLATLKSQRTDKNSSPNNMTQCPKLLTLCDTIASLSESANGILIFTQYRKMGEMISASLAKIGVEQWTEVPFLHGGLTTDERMKLVHSFNSSAEHRRPDEAPPILILSLKTGGLGLNLTGADNVIHYDRWWNPAVEDQATDRAHRFGQKRTVMVRTLTTEGTLEESIAKMFDDKRELAADLLGNSESVVQLAATEFGFLNLVDPRGIFVPRGIESEAMHGDLP